MPYSLLVRLAASLLLLAASACQRDRVRGLDADASAPETLDFGLLAVGERKELLLEVSNTSVVSLSVQGAEVARPFAAEVAADAAEVGGSARLKISFAPQAEGQAEATVTVSLSSPRTPSLAVRLKGAAYRPAVSVSAASGAGRPPTWTTCDGSWSTSRAVTPTCTAAS